MPYSWSTPPTLGTTPTAGNLDTLANDLGFIHQEFPVRAFLWHKDAAVVTGNALTVTVASGQDYGNYAYQSTSADADSFEQSFILAAGTYTLHVLGRTEASNGIIDWYLDGSVIKAGQDWYSLGTVTNVEKTVTGIVVSTTDRHVLTGTVNGKTGSGYDIELTAYWFEPEAGDTT